jgi:energy-coupling factor transport system permease protein
MLFYPHRQAVDEGSLALLEWGRVIISGAAIAALFATLVSIVTLMLLITLLTYTTDITDLMRGVQGLLRPLQRLGLPANDFSMILVIALRFVPLLGQELERLMKAQASRGADFGRGRGGVIRRVRQIFPLLIPLFITALRRAEEMATAMEARGYVGGRGRTHFVRLRMRRADVVALLSIIGLSAVLFAVDLTTIERVVAQWFSVLF